MIDRMPPMEPSAMNEAQRQAAAALVAGPRKGVFGPFIPLLRSPELMDRMQRVGEYLRFGTSLPPKLAELAVLVTARHVTNQFEWAVHVPLALREGVARGTIEALARGARAADLPADEAAVVDFCRELLASSGAGDDTYGRVLRLLGEQGVVDLVATVGYFHAICLVMNVAGTPAPRSDVAPLGPPG